MKDKIIEIIRNACAIDEDVTEESELLMLSLDSLSFVGVIMEIEETFSIEFELEELNFLDFKIVSYVIRFTEEKLKAKK